MPAAFRAPSEDGVAGGGIQKRSTGTASLGVTLSTHQNKIRTLSRSTGTDVERGWTRRRFDGDKVMDIAFCNGHLYCLLEHSKQLVKCEVSLTAYGVAGIRAVHWLAIQNHPLMTEADAMYYILELSGKVVMVVRTKESQQWSCEPFFLVLELVGADTDGVGTRHSYKWKEIRSLGNHTLFLGPTCAKAMHMSIGEHDYPRRNHVYEHG